MICPVERRIPYFRYRVRHGVRSTFFPRGIGDDFGRADVVHNPVNIPIELVPVRNGYCGERPAGSERARAQIGEARGQCRGYNGAVLKGIIADPHEIFGQDDLRQAVCVDERFRPDDLQTALLAEGYGRKDIVFRKRTIADRDDGRRKGQFTQRRIGKGVHPDLREAPFLGKRNRGERVALRKRAGADARDVGGNVHRFQCETTCKSKVRDGVQSAAERDLPQIEIHGKRTLAQALHAVRYVQTLQRRIGKGIGADRLHVAEPDFRQPRIGKSIGADRAEIGGRGIVLPQPGGIGDQRAPGMIVQRAADGNKGRVARPYPDGQERRVAVKSRTVDVCDARRQFEAAQAAAISKSKISDVRQSIARKRNGSQARIIVKGIFPDPRNACRHRDLDEVGAIAEGIIADLGQSVREIDLPQSALSVKGKRPDACNRFAVDLLRNGDVPPAARVPRDLHRAVIARNVCIRHAVVLVAPFRVQREIGRKDVLIPL